MVQKVKFGLLIVLCLASLLTAADFEQKISRRFELTAAGSVDLSNINGRIEISTRPGGAVEVLAVKSSDRKGEIESVDVIFDHQNDILRIHTKYNKKNTRAKVDFTVVIPEKLARTSFRSINGQVNCSGIYAELLLKSVNGRIKFDGEFARATLSAVNGAVDVSQEAELHGDLSVETVNGGIAVEIHRKSAFSIEGSTVNGGIVSEFPVKVERHLVGSSIHGVVNGGGRKLTLETVNGRISVSKI
jgi:hypothetical protein